MAESKPRDLCERTFLFACDVMSLCRVLSREPGLPRQIATQLFRAGTSVGANAEEAKSAYSRRDFASKSSLVLKEARESLYWLRLLEAAKLSSPEATATLVIEANELVAIYTATVRKAKAEPTTRTGQCPS